MNGFEPRLLVFLCRWCAYRGADAAGRQRRPVPWQVRPIQVPCAGRVTPQQILEAFRAGADGVLALACHPGDCHYRHGNLRAGHRVELLRAVLAQAGIAPERVRLDHVGAGEGERYAATTGAFLRAVRALGPLEACRG